MGPCTPSLVESFLTKYGWRYHAIGKGIWSTGWSSDHTTFPLRIVLDSSFVTFYVQPLLKLEVDILEHPEFACYMLERNQHSHLVKLGIDEIGDVVLSLALHRQTIDYDLFDRSLGLLGYYADLLEQELSEILSV